MRKWISLPRVEGTASRQAHTDLPEHTFEREMSKEGFFGPSAQFIHKHPPTSWESVEGPLQPRAFDTTKTDQLDTHPWQSPPLLHNDAVKIRYWQLADPMNFLLLRLLKQMKMIM